jgi:uncharacterized protein (DUF2147 family)
MRVPLLTLLLLATPILASAEGGPDISGNWARSDGKTRVNISSCGNQLCVTNTWIKDPSGSEAVGDKLVMTLTPQGASSLTGSAYDVKRDTNYSLQISAQNGRMQTTGCMLVGMVCKSMGWARTQ